MQHPKLQRPYIISELQFMAGRWRFDLSASLDMLALVQAQNCICQVRYDEFAKNRAHVHIDPRYNEAEVVQYIKHLLDSEPSPVDLGAVWAEAFDDEN